jgi:hypothetical protein
MAGFGLLQETLAETLGEPVECEHQTPEGDYLQATSTGLAVYSRAENLPLFTDGGTTWAVTFEGVISWTDSREQYQVVSAATLSTIYAGGGNRPTGSAAMLTAPAFTASAVGSRTSDGWVQVVAIPGPELIAVQNARGESFVVWQLGLLGADSGSQRDAGQAIHAATLPVGTKLWLAAQPGLDTAEGVIVRHFYRDGSTSPVAEELLRRGAGWLYPHALHSQAAAFANAQGEAAASRAGVWAGSAVTLYRPPGGAAPIPASAQLVPALQALAQHNLGQRLLQDVAAFPPSVQVGDLPQDVLGLFRGRPFSVQISSGITGADPASVATVLFHELIHARQQIQRGTTGRAIDCFGDEQEAFDTAASYWGSVFGQRGKPNPSHWLDNVLNQTLADYIANRTAASVRANYGHQCGAWYEGPSAGRLNSL